MDIACPASGSVVPFGKLRVFIALVPNEYPSEVLTFSNPLPSDGCGIPDDVTDLYIRVEVLTTASTTTPAASRIQLQRSRPTSVGRTHCA